MTTYLYADTETTGMWDFKAGVEDAKQPHLVQVAAILASEAGVESWKTYVKLPAGANIEPGAAKVHGITPAMLENEGMPLLDALSTLKSMMLVADCLVCHNVSFDEKVLKSAYFRAKIPFQPLPTFCTMQATTKICKLPGKYGYKWPTLDEAYRILVDPAGFEGAHDALADVKACRAVHEVLLARGMGEYDQAQS